MTADRGFNPSCWAVERDLWQVIYTHCLHCLSHQTL